MESNQLGQKIKKLRNKTGLSQDDFARKADVPIRRLQKVRTGVIKNLRFLWLTKSPKLLMLILRS